MNKRGLWNSKGQVTIFIIIAIIIIALGLLIYSFYPQIKSTIGVEEKTPQGYIQSCIEEDIESAVDEISLQGGSINPENYLLYENKKIEYLCYTNEYYRSCVVQQPMLKQHVESEIEKDIEANVKACFSSLRESYEKKGYSVELREGKTNVELLPDRIAADFDYSLTLTKAGAEKYDSFVVILNNNLYELTAIASSIVEWETLYGDSETTTYMTYYPDLKVEKLLRQTEGKIYTLTDRNTENKFQFAIRGQIWPPGYAIG